MELVVKILEDFLDIPGCSFDVLVKFTAFFYKFNCPIGKGKEG
jgi:hypothetical protein